MKVIFTEDTEVDICSPEDGSHNIERRIFKEGETVEIFIRNYALELNSNGALVSDPTMVNVFLKDGRIIYGLPTDCYQRI